MFICIYIYICIYVCVCVLDTCELISNDYADYGLADYGDCWLRDVCRPEKSKTKSLTGLEAVCRQSEKRVAASPFRRK